MRNIVAEIDRLNTNPSGLPEVEAHSTIRSPEVWATRQPILKIEAAESGFSPIKAAEVLSGFSFLEPASKATPQYPAQATPSPEVAKPNPLAAPTPAPLCSPDIEVNLTDDMKAFLNSDEIAKHTPLSALVATREAAEVVHSMMHLPFPSSGRSELSFT